MKRFMILFLAVALLICPSCGQTSDSNTLEEDSTEIDLDLTTLSSTVVYAEVYALLTEPDAYVGKTIRMRGPFSVFHSNDTGKDYYACIIKDATACCAQGLEFVLGDGKKYPDDYPAVGDEVTVTGTFSTYWEGEDMYCTLLDASLG